MKTIYLPIILVCFFLFGCEAIQNKFAFYPDQQTKINQEDLPAYIQSHEIITSDGEKLTAFHFTHSEERERKTILYFHGNAGNVYHRFGYCQKLWEMGNDILIISYRGYAESTGKPSESGIYEDGVSALSYLQDSLKIKPEDIVIMGRSIGTTVAINTAMHQPIGGLILVTPLTSGYEMAQQMVPSLASIATNTFPSIDKINDISAPLLVIHGTDDEVIPYAMGKQLYETYSGPKQFVAIKHGRHNDLQDVNPELFWGSIESFIKQLK